MLDSMESKKIRFGNNKKNILILFLYIFKNLLIFRCSISYFNI
jgi:hypothetical protein